MDKEYIKKLAEDPKFIPGIYNYCDRWCERCTLTLRCMNFALSEEELDNPQARDINNKSFWRKMPEILQVTLEMLEKAAREQGINLDILVHLDRLHRKTEDLFPDARAFVRPGFD